MGIAIDNSGTVIDFSGAADNSSPGGIMDSIVGYIQKAPQVIQAIADNAPKIGQAVGVVQASRQVADISAQQTKDALINRQRFGVTLPTEYIIAGALAIYLILRK